MKRIYNQPTVTTVNLMGGFVMQVTSSGNLGLGNGGNSSAQGSPISGD